MELQFYRDASDRLTYDRFDIELNSYPAACKKIIEHFQLKQASDPIVGADEIFWDFTNGKVNVQIMHDQWSGLSVTAVEPAAEQLVRDIALFLWEAVPKGSN